MLDIGRDPVGVPFPCFAFKDSNVFVLVIFISKFNGLFKRLSVLISKLFPIDSNLVIVLNSTIIALNAIKLDGILNHLKTLKKSAEMDITLEILGIT